MSRSGFDSVYTITSTEAREDEAGRRKSFSFTLLQPIENNDLELSYHISSCFPFFLFIFLLGVIFPSIIFSFYFVYIQFFHFSCTFYSLFFPFPSKQMASLMYVCVSVVLLFYSYTIVCRQDIKFPFTCLAGESFICIYHSISVFVYVCVCVRV